MNVSRLIMALLLGLLAIEARADEPNLNAALAIEATFADVIARAESGVVSIARPDSRDDPRADFGRGNRFRQFGRQRLPESVDLDKVPQFFGTGVVIGRGKKPTTRYVLTNDHVLRGGRPRAPLPENALFDVYLSNHRRVRASIVAADPRSDLAVLKLDLARTGIDPESVTPLKRGDASGIRKGQLVLAMGNPYAIARDGSPSASWGMVSNISRRPAKANEDGDSPADDTIHQFGTLLHVDTRLDLGMSGGALLNLKGELVGLTTSLAALRGYEKSVGYAIPIDAAMRRVIDDLLDGYEVEYGFLGIQPRDVLPSEMIAQRLPRKYVSAAGARFVAFDSPADRAGLERGDFVLSINDVPIRNAADLMREIGLNRPDTVATLSVWRRSTKQTFDMPVRLGKWPVQDDSRIIATHDRYPAWRGMRVDYPTARRRFQTSDVMERYHRAVLVTGVADDSPAAIAGLRVGDFVTHIDDKPIETPRAFHEVAANIDGDVSVVRLDGSRVDITSDAPAGSNDPKPTALPSDDVGDDDR